MFSVTPQICQHLVFLQDVIICIIDTHISINTFVNYNILQTTQIIFDICIFENLAEVTYKANYIP